MKKTVWTAVVVAALAMAFVASCASEGEEPIADDEIGSTASEARVCTTTALCVAGYHWDSNRCSCVADSTCTVTAVCVEGYTWSDSRCACVKDSGPKCGTRTCGEGTFCCNASCGTCAPIGGYCTQQVCGSAL